MANTFKLKRSAVSGKVPTTGDLQLGELAVNTYDGKLYTVKNDGSASVVRIGGTTDTALTFNNGGAGAASGTTFDGNTARTISYNTIGSPSTTGAGASGTWGISVTGNAATATSAGNITGGIVSGSYSVNTGSNIRFGHTNQTDTNDGVIGAGTFGSGLNIVGTQTSAGTGRLIRTWGSMVTSWGDAYVYNSGTWGINVTGSAGSCTGNAATASALQTGRTISLTGGVTGTSASWTGSGNLSIDTTVSNTSHKYHEFVAGSYFYDSYEQGRFFRLFTENYAYDTIRFCAIQDVEFYSYTNSAWEAWSGGDVQVKKLIDGRQETYTDLDHAHRTIRFTVVKNTGWPTTCLLAMYQSWYGTAWADVTITIEDATSTAGPWTVKRSVTWGAATTAANYGWHAYVTNDLHNGRTATRITINCADWVDNGGYIYKRINQLCLFSNFSGGTLQPWTWDYYKVVAFQATPTAPTAAVGTNTTALATTAFVNAEIANDAPTKTGGGASGTWGISISGNAATATSATNFDGVSALTRSACHRAQRAVTGGGTLTISSGGYVKWSARFIVIANGRGSYFGTSGYFDIACPLSGTITGVGGAGNVTATADGVPLGVWQALYYILPIGSNNGSLAANFRVATYTSDANIPHDWLLICVRNGDDGLYYFNNGIRLPLSSSLTTSNDARRALTADSCTGNAATATTVDDGTF